MQGKEGRRSWLNFCIIKKLFPVSTRAFRIQGHRLSVNDIERRRIDVTSVAIVPRSNLTANADDFHQLPFDTASR